MKDLSNNILENIMGVVNKVLFLKNKKVLELNGVSLYPSEVHLLLMIENKINTNATQIANELNLTKGAVSQTLTRLEKKGILLKSKDVYNKNELTLILTDFGKEVFKGCKKVESAFKGEHLEYIKKLDDHDKKVVNDFLKHMGDTFN